MFIDAASVVFDLDDEIRPSVRDRYLGRRCPGMPDHVGERFLDDPVGGEVDARREVARFARHVEPDIQSGSRGAGANMFTLPSGVRGMSDRGTFCHCAKAIVPTTITIASENTVSRTASPPFECFLLRVDDNNPYQTERR